MSIDDGESRKTGRGQRCNATTKNGPNKGNKCLQNARRGSRYCHMHRACDAIASQVGPGHHLWKGGVSHTKAQRMKYRSRVPEHLQEALNRLSENPDLLKSHDEIVLMDARIEELLGQLSSGATSEKWSEARDLIERVFTALKEEDSEKVVRLLTSLRGVLTEGSDNAEDIWSEIQSVVESRRRVIDTERKIIETEQIALRPDKLLIVASEIGRVVRKYLDREQYEDFSKEFRQIFLGESEIRELIDLK